MDNATRRQLLEQTKQAQQEGFKGSIMDVYNNPQILQQQSPVTVANTPQQQSQGLRGVERQNAPQAMVFPNLAPNTPMNTKGMKFNVDMDMYDPKGHLMQSYKDVPPGVESLPTGPRGATVVERPTRQTGGTYADSLRLHNMHKLYDLDDMSEYEIEMFDDEYSLDDFMTELDPTHNLSDRKIEEVINSEAIKPVGRYNLEGLAPYYKKPTGPPAKNLSYAEAYKKANKSEYPTLKSFTKAAKNYKKYGSNTAPIKKESNIPRRSSSFSDTDPRLTTPKILNPKQVSNYSNLTDAQGAPLPGYKYDTKNHIVKKQTGGTYADSLNLYNAYQFQKSQMPVVYDEFLEHYGKNYPGGRDALEATRTANIGPPGTLAKTGGENFYGSASANAYDPIEPSEQPIVDYYNSLKFDGPIDIGMHSSPDIYHKNIDPVNTYWDGLAWSPVYKKPTGSKGTNRSYKAVYNNEVDKKKYPTLESFIEAAENYKKYGSNTKPVEEEIKYKKYLEDKKKYTNLYTPGAAKLFPDYDPSKQTFLEGAEDYKRNHKKRGYQTGGYAQTGKVDKKEFKSGVNSFVSGTPIQDQYDDLITIKELGAGNSRTFTDDNKHNTFINKMINRGTHGYNSKTGTLIKLDTPLKGLSKEEEFMGTRAYANNVASRNDGFTSKKQDAQIKKLPKEQQEKINAANYNLRRNLVGEQNQKMVQNPLYYAPGVIAATAFGAPVLAAAGEATFAGAGPSVAAAWNTTIPGLTALGEGATIGNAINAGFATHGAMNIGPNVQDFVEDPSWEGAGKIGMNALEIAPVVGPAFRTGVEGLSAAKNVGKILTEETALKNAHKLNPLAFKPNSKYFYRGIGKTGLDDALEKGVIKAPENTAFGNDKVFMSENLYEAEMYSKNKSTFQGDPFDEAIDAFKEILPKNVKSYIAEIPKSKANFVKQGFPGSGYSTINPKLSDVNLYKEHWLQGYKKIKPTSKKLYSQNLGNLSKPEKGIIGASSETLNPLKVSTKTNKLKPTEGGISEGAKDILKNKDVAPNANNFSNITEVNPFNQAQARIYAQQGEEGALQLFEEFAEGANTLDKFKTSYLKDLTSPEGVRRLIAQERKALEKLGYPKRGLERQSEANAEARIGEIKNIINKNQEIVDGKISAKAVADNNYNFNNASYQRASPIDIYMDQLLMPKGLNMSKYAETRIGGIEAPGKAGLGTMYKNSVPTASHEIGGHGLQAGRVLDVDVNLQKLKVTKDGLNAQGKKDYKYFLNKLEPSAFLHEAREAMLAVGLIKSRHQYISPEKLKIAKLYFNRKPFGTINTYNKKFASDTRILDFADDVKQNWELLSREINALPGIVPGAIGTGVATGVALGSTKSEKTMKTGGYKRLPRY